MNPLVTTALSIISWLVSNRAQIKQTIVEIESLVPDAPGATKLAAVKGFIATSMGIESQIEGVWPLVAPLFNALVSLTKKPAATVSAA